MEPSLLAFNLCYLSAIITYSGIGIPLHLLGMTENSVSLPPILEGIFKHVLSFE